MNVRICMWGLVQREACFAARSSCLHNVHCLLKMLFLVPDLSYLWNHGVEASTATAKFSCIHQDLRKGNKQTRREGFLICLVNYASLSSHSPYFQESPVHGQHSRRCETAFNYHLSVKMWTFDPWRNTRLCGSKVDRLYSAPAHWILAAPFDEVKLLWLVSTGIHTGSHGHAFAHVHLGEFACAQLHIHVDICVTAWNCWRIFH